MSHLCRPHVYRCYFDETFTPPVPAMELRWASAEDREAERTWHLPEGLVLKGPAPRQFGVTIQRMGDNTYRIRLLWNRVCVNWNDLSRAQIMASSLAIILAALGTDLWEVLNQPIEEPELQAA